MSTARRGPSRNCLRSEVTRLGKAQVEALLGTYDAAPQRALTVALRIALDSPTLDWAELVDLAEMSDQRRTDLLRGEPLALDSLAAELNEVRCVAARTPPSRPATGDDCEPPSDRRPR